MDIFLSVAFVAFVGFIAYNYYFQDKKKKDSKPSEIEQLLEREALNTKINQEKIEIRFGNNLLGSQGKRNLNINFSKVDKYMKNKIIMN